MGDSHRIWVITADGDFVLSVIANYVRNNDVPSIAQDRDLIIIFEANAFLLNLLPVCRLAQIGTFIEREIGPRVAKTLEVVQNNLLG